MTILEGAIPVLAIAPAVASILSSVLSSVISDKLGGGNKRKRPDEPEGGQLSRNVDGGTIRTYSEGDFESAMAKRKQRSDLLGGGGL